MIVIINTCKKYSHIWPITNILIKKYWNNCPYKIIWISDIDVNNNEDNFYINNDKGWSSNLISFLKKTKENRFFIILEDYLLYDFVNNYMIDKGEYYMNKYDFGLVRLTPYHNQSKYGLLNWDVDLNFGIINKNDNYSICLQPSIWSKETLFDLLLDNENAWDFEINGSKRCNICDKKFISLKNNVDKVYPYVQGLRRGIYTDESINFLKKEKLYNYVNLNYYIKK